MFKPLPGEGPMGRDEEGKRLQKGLRKLWMMGTCVIFIMVMLSWDYICKNTRFCTLNGCALLDVNFTIIKL